MNRPPSMFDNIRSVLILVLVFFVAVLFSGFILGPIITVLFYLFQRYYKRSKQLEKRLADLTSQNADAQMNVPPPSSIPPPPSTDA
jgi:predicted PurR-regulated permease PerM